MAEIDMGVYNRLFPYYIEACAVTQYHKRGAKPGGWGGHATIFMSGAEIDPGAGYPRLRLASAGADLPSSDSGVGVSVNQIFTNVNWVAVPGRLDFFRGGLAAEQILDDSLYEAAVQRATAAGWFDGIAVRYALVRQKPPGMPLQEFVVRHSIGPALAMNFAPTMNDGSLSAGPGALIATYPMHDGGRNRLFAAGRDPFLFSVPMLWDKEEKFRRLTRTPPSTVTDLYANLTHFRDRYLEALATQPASNGDTFGERFRERLAEELHRTDSLIAGYRLLDGARSR